VITNKRRTPGGRDAFAGSATSTFISAVLYSSVVIFAGDLLRRFQANFTRANEFLPGLTASAFSRNNVKAPAKSKEQKGPWRCPKCGREFPKRQAFHSCGNYTVEGYLQGKNPHAVALFKTLVETAQSFGPFTVSPAKTQIGFRGRVTFLMVSVTGKRISGYLFLNRAVNLPCFQKVKAVSANRHVHVFQISDFATIQGEFSQALAEAIENATEQEDAPKTKGSSPRIGEEINAIYRQARLQSAPRP
jgi:hypothetical protein